MRWDSTPIRFEFTSGPNSALATNVGDVEGEAVVSLARTQDEGAPGCSSRTRTQPGASLAVVNATNVGGRGTSQSVSSSQTMSKRSMQSLHR
jgi:hypothetical protein